MTYENRSYITMTEHRQVTILTKEWPRIATGEYNWHDSEIKQQALRERTAKITVRRHQDGRCLVYGVYYYSTACRGEEDFTARAGILLTPNEDIIKAIGSVKDTLITTATDYDQLEAINHIRTAAADCIADLPPIHL